MPRTNRDRVNPWVLIAISVGLIAAAFFFYTGHPVLDSNLYSPHAPAWVAVVMFIVVGVIIGLVRASYRKHDAENARRNAQRKDLTNR